MFRRNLVIMITALFVSVILQGCSQNPESNVAKNTNTNQAVKASNLNSDNSGVNASNAPVNNAGSNGNSVPAGNKNSVSKASDPPPKIGSGGSDLALVMQARSQLSADKELINSVIIEIKEGNATLNGKVSSADQKKKAEQIVKSVQGIKSIKNNLSVSQ